jgi:tetratricopeptide (TPR) repeat protein
MRALFVAGWLMLPIGFAFWHHGPGQDRVRLDDAADLLRAAQRHADAGEWADAVAAYEKALELLPEGQAHQRHRVGLEKAKAQMLCSQLPTAHDDLKSLVEELQSDPAADKALLADARSTLAQAQFYMTWLMRLEGLPEEAWGPEIEAARQSYRLLAEGATGPAKEKHQKDLEAAVRLARMDLGELQGLPLPSQ